MTQIMSNLAHKENRYDEQWGVINPGNALCHSIHRTRQEARDEKKRNAGAYGVIRVKIIPLYEEDGSITGRG